MSLSARYREGLEELDSADGDIWQATRYWFGGYPTISLADARKTARKYRAIARSGGDPIAFRTQAPAPTFKVTAEQVHQQQIIPTRKNAIHQNQWINTLRDYAFLEIGELSIGEAIGAMWDEIDFENTNWTVPGNRMKGDVELSSPTITNYH